MPTAGSNACETPGETRPDGSQCGYICRCLLSSPRRPDPPVQFFGYRQGSIEAGDTAKVEPTDARAPAARHADAVCTRSNQSWI